MPPSLKVPPTVLSTSLIMTKSQSVCLLRFFVNFTNLAQLLQAWYHHCGHNIRYQADLGVPRVRLIGSLNAYPVSTILFFNELPLGIRDLPPRQFKAAATKLLRSRPYYSIGELFDDDLLNGDLHDLQEVSPGPRYILPSTTGFLNHDPTRTQAPAFSFGVTTAGNKVRTKAPGPKYDVRGFTEHGKLTTQQAVVLGRWNNTLKKNRTPAPKSFDTSVTQPTAPAYSIGHKRPDMRRSKMGPGPNKYLMPTCMGPNIPDKKAEPAYSILSRNFTTSKRQAPGPKYMLPDNNVYLKTPPRVAMLGRNYQKYNKGVPGPNKYKPIPTYEKSEAMKGISFGVKHSPEKHLPMMPEDRVQEAFVF